MEPVNPERERSIRRIIILIWQVQILESIKIIFRKFNFGNESGLLQYWACKASNLEDVGCSLTLTNQPFKLNILDKEGDLLDYWRRCLDNRYPSVGLETRVGNWSAGRAAQTRIADHWTIHHVVNEEDQHSADVGGMGQLVLPVFAGKKLVGIIEYVTPVPKESYVQYFEYLHNLLQDEGLKSSYIGKTVKVKYDNMIIKFTLPLSAKLKDLQSEVTKRFEELKGKNFHVVEYHDDTEAGKRLPILSDEDLQGCMAESSLKGAKVIRMCVILNT